MAGYCLIPLQTKQGVWTIDKLTLYLAALNQITVMLLTVLSVKPKSHLLTTAVCFCDCCLRISLQRWVMTKVVHMVTMHTVGFNVTNLVHCKFSVSPTVSKIFFKLLNHPFMMVLIYAIARYFHTGMLLDSQFGMVHASQVWFPQHENIALQIKSQQLQGKLLLWSALTATHCLFAIFSTAYVTAYCSLISLLTVLLNSINLPLKEWSNSAL